ncbi:MAG: hypothetical protein OXE99_08565 [Cellvibrionales bacterium]|nr:hypothetical protein [Cellvibrionales bacterium]
MNISKKSDWDRQAIERYLLASVDPMRFSVVGAEGFPLICSIWHWYEADHLFAVSHQNSLLVKTLETNAKCAFDISVNTPPYRGVRGVGLAVIETDAQVYLPKLLEKFLGAQYQGLQDFLTDRLEEERLIKVAIQSISAWDFSHRMVK